MKIGIAVVLSCVCAGPARAQIGSPTAPAPPMTPGGFPGQWAPTPSDWKYPVWPSGCGRFQGDERAAHLALRPGDQRFHGKHSAARNELAAASFAESVGDSSARNGHWIARSGSFHAIARSCSGA